MQVTVLGIGNQIMSDDGVGLSILDALAQQPRAGVQFIHGGTAGMENLPAIEDAKDLLVLDALAGPGAPGQVHTIEGDQIPRLLQQQLSPHQVGLLDLLSAARLLGKEPERVAVVGIVAHSTELHIGLSKCVEASLGEACMQAEAVLQRWGV